MLVLYAFSGLAAAASLLLTATHQKYDGFVIVLVCLAAWLGLQHLGYNEFGVAGKLALGGSFRGLINAQLVLIGFEQELSASKTIEQCWEVLCLSCPRFGFSGIELQLDGIVCHGDFTGRWYVRIDLPGHGYINLMRKPGASDRGAEAVLFMDCISRVFNQKLDELRSNQSEFREYASAD